MDFAYMFKQVEIYQNKINKPNTFKYISEKIYFEFLQKT